MTNPRLANKTVPPSHAIAVSVDVLDAKGPFVRISGTLRIVDKTGAVVEEGSVGASVNQRGAQSEAEAITQLGYVVGAYIVCRTSDHPDRCTN